MPYSFLTRGQKNNILYYIKNGGFFVTDGTSGANHGGAKNRINADRLGSPISGYTGVGLPFCFLLRAKNSY